MGSELIQRGEVLPNHIWSADSNLKNPELVYRIHKEYIEAGSTYITANTFRTTPRAYSKTGLSYSDSIDMAHKSLKTAVKMAKKAANDKINVLGSIAPLEDCYQPKLFPGKNIAKQEFKQLGKWLKDEGVDIFLIETMNSIDETKACLDVISDLDLPIWVGFVLLDSTKLLSGEYLTDAISRLNSYNVDCLLLNCNPLARTEKAMKIVTQNWTKKWGIYPNLGVGEPSPDGIIENIHSDEQFLEIINNSISLGAKVVGGCCGSNARHIQLINRSIGP